MNTTTEPTYSTPPVSQQSVWDELGRALSPIEYRPQVVGDLEASHHTTRKAVPYVVIRNPSAATYLKLDPNEHDLLSLMDGTCTVKALAVEYYKRHNVLALPRIAGLVRLLRANRFLTDPPIDAYSALATKMQSGHASLGNKVVKRFMHTQFPIRGADRVIGAWYRSWGRVFFTRPAIIIGAALAVLGPILFFYELSRNRYPLFTAAGSYLLGMILIGALTMVTLFIHEVGHGMAVKHARRYIAHAGMMIYYGFPAGYVNTTDIWMAPRKMRLLASIAGPWTGLVLGGVTSLVVVLMAQNPVGAFLFAWSFVFLIDNLFNFNPLLELDGYYILVDLLEKPKLRARALGFVRGPLWAKLWRRNRLTGEERFFAWFGLASVIWSVLMIVVTLRFWEAKIERLVNQAWASGDTWAQVGIVVVVGALGLALVVPLVLTLLGLARTVRRWLSLRIRWLGGRASARLRRRGLEALRAVPLWANLPEARLLEMARAMRSQRVEPGTSVVRQGEPGDRFYFIHSGTFEVYVDEQLVKTLCRGDYFGERALLQNVPRTATVTALERGILFSLDNTDFQAMLAHDLVLRSRLEDSLAYREEVAQIPLFKELTPSELDLLLVRLVPMSVGVGDIIVRQGESGDRFYMIRSGRVEVVQDGRVLDSLGTGSAFGEIALLMDVTRTATVRALEHTELLTLSASDFQDLLLGYLGRSEELAQLSQARLRTHGDVGQE